ncbi:hypothetical protein SAMN05192558_108356 [Actinokineospora alba]|uniref:Uncharacterized protein n=2 Tax=Actinokineospora alba TaxID=504798 RepID=A0A1H0SBD8_9PSEU|nr:hypothetical protein C8E96_2205 [Actinokineospora alba]SDI51757.1 hypothetical protein SAMN05421871_105367 [Actinokineospora alba]SDP38548.1 hypothetical protein SAMN05192558_108356 [Actinokineospora alba]
MDVRNSSKGWLVLWLEPLGEDRWLKPGEVVRVRSDYGGDEPAFSVDFWEDDRDRDAGIQNINVWIEQGDCYAEVTDHAGNVVECGHQRPEEVDRKWRASLGELPEQT